MSAIRAKNTRPEMTVRRALHAAGFRYRLHGGKLPGRPDLVLPRYQAVILVHGCFFHGHKCHYFRWPATRAEFWRAKIGGNAERDVRNVAKLRAEGWRVLIVWECAVRSPGLIRDHALLKVTKWLHSSSPHAEIAGAELQRHS